MQPNVGELYSGWRVPSALPHLGYRFCGASPTT